MITFTKGLFCCYFHHEASDCATSGNLQRILGGSILLIGQDNNWAASQCEDKGPEHGSEDMQGICSPKGDGLRTNGTGLAKWRWLRFQRQAPTLLLLLIDSIFIYCFSCCSNLLMLLRALGQVYSLKVMFLKMCAAIFPLSLWFLSLLYILTTFKPRQCLSEWPWFWSGVTAETLSVCCKNYQQLSCSSKSSYSN